MNITSAANPHIKEVVKLHTAKGRKEAGRFIIEGKRALSTAVKHLKLHTLFATDAELPYAQSLSDNVIIIPDALMKKISTTKTPSGVLGVAQIPPNTLLNQLSSGLVLANIADPGNMGTLIRTAAACALDTVVIIEGCDPWSPKVVQSSAGTICLVKLIQCSWEELCAHKNELTLAALVVSGGRSPSTLDPHKSLIIVGNEAHGIPPEWLNECDEKITLPMPGGTESLNAAIAGSIVMYKVHVDY